MKRNNHRCPCKGHCACVAIGCERNGHRDACLFSPPSAVVVHLGDRLKGEGAQSDVTFDHPTIQNFTWQTYPANSVRRPCGPSRVRSSRAARGLLHARTRGARILTRWGPCLVSKTRKCSGCAAGDNGVPRIVSHSTARTVLCRREFHQACKMNRRRDMHALTWNDCILLALKPYCGKSTLTKVSSSSTKNARPSSDHRTINGC